MIILNSFKMIAIKTVLDNNLNQLLFHDKAFRLPSLN